MGSSLARVICETSQVLLANGQVFFFGGDLSFSSRLTIDSASEIILTGRKTHIKKNVCKNILFQNSGFQLGV